MEYREIEAASIDDAKIKIKKEFGERARIIKVTESSRGGFIGFGKKKFVKVLVSISDIDLLKKYKENLGIESISKKTGPKEKNAEVNEIQNLIDKDNSINLLIDKLNNIEKVIAKNNENNNDFLHANLFEVKQILKENEFSDDFIDSLIESVKDNLPYSKIENRLEVHKFVYDYIKDKIVLAECITRNTGKKNILVLVGPTGVGKTTTIAKIAANAIREKLKVELITIDGYRIGAKYQLEKYAEYMKTPMHGIEDNLELQKIIDLSNADLILIDTIGRSANDEMNLVKMKQLLKMERHSAEYVLTISASVRYNDVVRIFKSFDIFDYNSIIITKLDESETIGAILENAVSKNKGIRYLTIGQRVPNDIEKASLCNLMEKIRGLEMEVYLDSVRT